MRRRRLTAYGARLLRRMVTARGGGGAVALAVRPTAGGRRLYDPGTGAEYATAATGPYAGCYVDSAGNPLAVDAGWSVGDEVGHTPGNGNGVLRLYTAHGVEVGTVTGTPATGRRAGFDAISDAAHAGLNLTGTAYTMIAKVSLSTVMSQDSIIVGTAASGDRWGFYSQPGTLVCARLNTAGSPVTSSAINASLVGTGTRYLAATYDGATDSTSVHCYDAAGAIVVRDEDPRAGGPHDLSGPFHVGRARGAGVAFTAGSIDMGLGLDGVALSTAAIDAIVADLASGATTIADYAGSFQLPTDGLINGAIDGTDPTALAYIGAEGDGTPVRVVEVTL